MNNKLIALAVAASIASPMAANAAVESKWFGFTQITATQRSDKKAAEKDGLTFGADRVRIGYKLKDGNVFGGLQVDFVKTAALTASADGSVGDHDHLIPTQTGTLPDIIKDAFAGYKFSNAASIKLGQFKTPVGMDFNTSGKKLDITKRGLEKSLVLERTAGVMLSGRKIAGGIGYDLFYGNPAGRSVAAVSVNGNGGVNGKDNTTAARVSYDMGKLMHAELSYGTTTTSVAGASDYEVIDFAMAYKRGPITGKFEYIDGDGIKYTTNRKEKVYLLHFGYQFSKMFEGIVRHYQAKHNSAAGVSSDLGNTYLGANLFLGSNKTNGRLQLNYVVATGDTTNGGVATANPYTGNTGGYTDDAILIQYQVSF